jgi:hypothetical protein
VLVGGLTAACLLFFIFRFDSDAVANTLTAQEQYYYYLDQGSD